MRRRPFQQGRFSDLPELPCRPHRYFEVPESYVDVRSRGFGLVRTHYRALGDGPPLLLVHGLMTTSYSFRYVMHELAKTRRVYVLDLPGAGRSDKPKGPYSARALASFLIDFVDALGIRGCDAVGNSMGGYLCMRSVLEDSRVFGRLVNIHSPGVTDTRYLALHAGLSSAIARNALARVIALSPLRWAHANVHYHDESLKSREEAREYALSTDDHRRAFIAYLHDTFDPAEIRAFEKMLVSRRDARLAFPIPLLLLYSRADPLVPPRVGEKLHDLIPDARFEWLDDTSHFAHVDTPGPVLASVLRFFAR